MLTVQQLTANGVHADDMDWFTQQIDSIPDKAAEGLLKKYALINGGHEGETRRLRNSWLLDNSKSLREIAATKKIIQDYSTKNALDRLLNLGNEPAIARAAKFIKEPAFKNAIAFQSLNEEKIRKHAGRLALNKNSEFFKQDLAARRHLRKQAKQSVSILNLNFGVVGKNGYQYATPFETELRNQQKARWRTFAANQTIERDGQELNMLDIMQASQKSRFAEIYTLIKGLEKYSNAAGMSWAFLTLTAPPQMHPNPKMGKENWDGTTPDEAHQWIHEHYHNTEARLRKRGIVLSGLRVVEPHEDACPHWHSLIFFDPANTADIEREFRKTPQWKSEAGLKFVLNNGQASAASYVTKYVLKTISSIEKLEGEQGSVDAWRSTWSIRAFQFFGMPPLQLWRDLRRLKECPSEPLLAGLWRAAHRGDGAGFIGLAGGLNVRKKDRSVISQTNSNDETRSTVFVVRETGEMEINTQKKWQRQNKNSFKKPAQPNETGRVEVIHNYPSGGAAFGLPELNFHNLTCLGIPLKPSKVTIHLACAPTGELQLRFLGSYKYLAIQRD